jgi:ankyrin repeat protein
MNSERLLLPFAVLLAGLLPAGDTARQLGKAASQGDVQEVKRLLASGADANAAGGGEEPPICQAAQAGRGAVVQVLLEAGAKPDSRMEKGVLKGASALWLAAVSGDPAAVGSLLGAGADPDAAGPRGFTPLVVAIAMKHPMLARAIVAKGAQVNAVDPEGRAAVMTASIIGDAGLLEYLLDAGADLNLRDKDGYSALMWAAERGNTAVVRLLLLRGADPSYTTKGKNGKDALTLAAGHSPARNQPQSFGIKGISRSPTVPPDRFPDTAAVLRSFQSQGAAGLGGSAVEPASPVRVVEGLEIHGAGPSCPFRILAEFRHEEADPKATEVKGPISPEDPAPAELVEKLLKEQFVPDAAKLGANALVLTESSTYPDFSKEPGLVTFFRGMVIGQATAWTTRSAYVKMRRVVAVSAVKFLDAGTAPAGSGNTAEAAFWNWVRRVPSPTAVGLYLAAFPQGAFLGEARRMMPDAAKTN